MRSRLFRRALPCLIALLAACDRSSPAPDGGATAQPCDTPETCEAACDRGDGAACRWAAEALKGLDTPRAIGLYEKACQRGIADTCLRAWSHLKEDAATVERARAAAEKGCELGDAQLCLSAAKAQLGIDSEKTKKLRDRASQLDSAAPHQSRNLKDGCALLDDPLVERAAKAHAACDRGEPHGCDELGDILLRAGEDERSAEAYGKSCAGRGFKEKTGIERCVDWLRGRRGAPPLHPDTTAPQSSRMQVLAEWGFIGILGGDPRANGLGASTISAPDAGVPDKPLPPGVRPHVRVGKMSPSDQPLAPLLEKAIRSLEPDLLTCYARGLVRQPRLRGRIGARFVIDRLGEASMIINGGSDLPDSDVTGCVVELIGRLRLDPPPAELTPVTLPLLFSPK